MTKAQLRPLSVVKSQVPITISAHGIQSNVFNMYIRIEDKRGHIPTLAQVLVTKWIHVYLHVFALRTAILPTFS